MNIYEKLNKAKLALKSSGLKKSGKNEFAKYDYFELSDFVPAIIGLENELGFCCVISFGLETAYLVIVDTVDATQQIKFTSPMSSASIKGMHDVQNLGAVQTYLRRYLYTTAFEIVEQDAIEKTSNPTAKPVAQASAEPSKITEEQFRVLASPCKDSDEEKNRLKEIYTRYGYKSAKDIDQKDFAAISKEFLEYGLPFKI